MRITFLMPGWPWVPSGGFRVVYEYASRLAERNHDVTVVHPQRLLYVASPAHPFSTRLRSMRMRAKAAFGHPVPHWQPISSRVQMLYVADSAASHIPAGDALFATAWQTVPAVLRCSPAQGERFYLIQGYETWMGEKEAVDATWRAIPNRIVVGRWMLDIADSLGCKGTAYIPNGVNRRQFFLRTPIAARPHQVALQYSTVPVKGTRCAVEALKIVRHFHPDLRVVCFGVDRRQSWLPGWFEFHRNPDQTFLVDHIYNHSAIYLSPSLSEGCGLPLSEAAACGCALAATDIGGHREHVVHGQTGLLSEPGGAVAMAANVSLLLENSEMRIGLARAAMNLIASRDWNDSTTHVEDFVRTVLSRQHSVEAGAVC